MVSAGASPDVVAEIGHLAGLADPEVAATGYRQAVRDAYWDTKDLGAVAWFAAAGFVYCRVAARNADAEVAYRLQSEAKALMYDVASFTWPGWAEPGVEVLGRDLQIGCEAAVANLRLAAELDKGDLALARARWMLGGHLLAAGRHSEAGDQYSQSAVLAEAAGSPEEARLGEAFAALGAVLAGADGAQQSLDAAIVRLAAAEGGAALVEQLTTARDVFGAPPQG
jgi:hypothetical protein